MLPPRDLHKHVGDRQCALGLGSIPASHLPTIGCRVVALVLSCPCVRRAYRSRDYGAAQGEGVGDGREAGWKRFQVVDGLHLPVGQATRWLQHLLGTHWRIGRRGRVSRTHRQDPRDPPRRASPPDFQHWRDRAIIPLTPPSLLLLGTRAPVRSRLKAMRAKVRVTEVLLRERERLPQTSNSHHRQGGAAFVFPSPCPGFPRAMLHSRQLVDGRAHHGPLVRICVRSSGAAGDHRTRVHAAGVVGRRL